MGNDQTVDPSTLASPAGGRVRVTLEIATTRPRADAFANDSLVRWLGAKHQREIASMPSIQTIRFDLSTPHP